MYTIKLIVDPAEHSMWGEFAVRKGYEVTQGGISEGVFGYIVQRVQKVTTLNVGEEQFTTSEQIAKFTDNNVLFATETYYEVFPILNGVNCLGKPRPDRDNCVDDQFQNGALLRYVLNKRNKKWYADDEPPTTGTITMIGTNIFIQSEEGVANAIYEMIKRPRGGTINIDGKDWSLDAKTPANGLPYSGQYDMREGGVVHRVVVTWNDKGDTTVESSQPVPGGRRSTRGRTASKLRYKRRTGRTRRR